MNKIPDFNNRLGNIAKALVGAFGWNRYTTYYLSSDLARSIVRHFNQNYKLRKEINNRIKEIYNFDIEHYYWSNQTV